MDAFKNWWDEYGKKQGVVLSEARAAVLEAPVEQLPDFLDDSNGRLGHFLSTTGAVLKEVCTDEEHGGEASTMAHRKECYQCAREYELWRWRCQGTET